MICLYSNFYATIIMRWNWVIFWWQVSKEDWTGLIGLSVISNTGFWIRLENILMVFLLQLERARGKRSAAQFVHFPLHFNSSTSVRKSIQIITSSNDSFVSVFEKKVIYSWAWSIICSHKSVSSHSHIEHLEHATEQPLKKQLPSALASKRSSFSSLLLCSRSKYSACCSLTFFTDCLIYCIHTKIGDVSIVSFEQFDICGEGCIILVACSWGTESFLLIFCGGFFLLSLLSFFLFLILSLFTHFSFNLCPTLTFLFVLIDCFWSLFDGFQFSSSVSVSVFPASGKSEERFESDELRSALVYNSLYESSLSITDSTSSSQSALELVFLCIRMESGIFSSLLSSSSWASWLITPILKNKNRNKIQRKKEP